MQRWILQRISSSATSPVFLRQGNAQPRPADLAIAVNGTIRAVTRTISVRNDVEAFSAVVPENSFRSGDNTVDVFAIVSGTDGRVTLAPVKKGSNQGIHHHNAARTHHRGVGVFPRGSYPRGSRIPRGSDRSSCAGRVRRHRVHRMGGRTRPAVGRQVNCSCSRTGNLSVRQPRTGTCRRGTVSRRTRIRQLRILV